MVRLVMRKSWIVQRTLRENPREARRVEHRVLLPQRNRHPFGQSQQQRATRHGAAGFQEAQMPGGNLRVTSELELAETAPLTPFPDQDADGAGRGEHSKMILRVAP